MIFLLYFTAKQLHLIYTLKNASFQMVDYYCKVLARYQTDRCIVTSVADPYLRLKIDIFFIHFCAEKFSEFLKINVC
jgi:hypothetical protein